MSPPRQMLLGSQTVHDDSPCYVIAEIGHNHQGSVEQCQRMFAAAKEAGASAVKLQKRDNSTLFTQAMYDKPYDNPNSFGRTYGQHREALEFDRDEYVELIACAAELGIDFFATAFDRPSVEFLEDVGNPAYKVASADVTNLPLLRDLAATGKPVIVSTGGASMTDVRRAHDTLRDHGTRHLAILQCTAGYPAAWDELDLRVITTYRDEFPEAVVGLSSHDNGIAMAIVAYTLGGRIVEKHFTLDRTMRGSDHAFSLEPQGLHKLVRDLGRTHQALGSPRKSSYASEHAPITKMAKSIVAARDLPSGHVLTEDDLRICSPGGGMPPSLLDDAIGCVLRHPVPFETQLTLDALAPEGHGRGELSRSGFGRSEQGAPSSARPG